MRIISGSLRGRSFEALPGQQTTRPTAGRVREALFNILYPRLEGAHVLDCFAGTGALSFEALSRGAAGSVMCELDRKAATLLVKNVEKLGLGDRVQILRGDFLTQGLPSGKFDIILIDPPYGTGLLEKALVRVEQQGLLAQDGCVVCESGRRFAPSGDAGSLLLRDQRVYGSTVLSFYEQRDES